MPTCVFLFFFWQIVPHSCAQIMYLSCKAPTPPTHTHTPFHCFCTMSTFDSYLSKLWLCLCSYPFVFLLLLLPTLFQRSSLYCKDWWLPLSIWVDLPATSWASCKQANSFIFPMTSFPALAHNPDYYIWRLVLMSTRMGNCLFIQTTGECTVSCTIMCSISINLFLELLHPPSWLLGIALKQPA